MGNNHIGKNFLHIICVTFAWIMVLGLDSQTILAQQLGEQDSYDLILEVKRDKKTLSRALLGLERNEKYYVPIQGLGQIVQLNTNVDLKNETARGFILSEDNPYEINLKNNTYTVGGQTVAFNADDAFVFNQKFGIGDIYVTPELLNKIWPLQLNLEMLLQTLQIGTNKKLPYELSLERQRKRNKLSNKESKKDPYGQLGFPKIDNSYKMFSMPALDFNATTSVDNQDSGIGQTLNVIGRNDLLNAQASYNVRFEKDPNESLELSTARFLLERQSYEDGDMPLGLHLAQAGDVRSKPSRLIDGSLRGRGVLVSTESQKQVIDFDQITVEGVAEPGWEVELYRNNELLGFQIVDNQGEYRFENISLNYNNTIIKTIFYGPEGQVREVEKKYNISDSMLKPGKTIFEASVLEQNKNLISTDNDPQNQPEGLAQNYILKRGITPWLSGFATFTATSTRDGQDRNYGTLGVNLSFFGISGLAEAYKDFSGGEAYDLRAAGHFAGVNTNLRTAYFNNFESAEANFDGAARKSRTQLSLSKPFKILTGSFGLRFRADHQTFQENPERTEFELTQSFGVSGLRVTHGNKINLIDKDHQDTDGRLNATYRINKNWQLRSLLNYDLYPDKRFQNLIAEIRYRDKNKLTASVDVNRNFIDKATRLGANISYDFEKFRLGLNTDWDKDNGARAFARASFSMAPYGEEGDYIYSSSNLSNRSALNTRVFLDKNYDGEFDSGDALIENAKVDIGRRETKASELNGIATYLGSPRNQYENVTLDTDTLDNLYMLPGNAGYSTVLRPGTMVTADFPVIETGLVDGIVDSADGPIAGVRMQLVENGAVLDTVSTAFDGYYLFEYVEPGTYVIRVDPSYDELAIPPQEIVVTSENLFDYQVDFQLFEQTDEVACADTDSDGRITQRCRDLLAQGRIKQSVLTIPEIYKDQPTVENLRMFERPDFIRMVLDFNKKPAEYKIIKDPDSKEVTVILSGMNWAVMPSWSHPTPEIIKGYRVEMTQEGDTKITLRPVEALNIIRDKTLKPTEKTLGPDQTLGHRIYLDIAR